MSSRSSTTVTPTRSRLASIQNPSLSELQNRPAGFHERSRLGCDQRDEVWKGSELPVRKASRPSPSVLASHGVNVTTTIAET
jgi:hypothetical protein